MADVINPAYLSMPAQVQKNKNDIEALRNSMFLADPEGQYSSDKTYGKGALVAYTDGNIYYHFSETETQGVPPTNAETWIMYQEGIPGPQGETGETGKTPNIAASASVTNTTGVPEVNVTKGGTAEAPTFAFAFQNIKGDTGPQGMSGTNGSNGYPIYLVTSDYGATSPRVYKTSVKTPAGYPDPISGSIVYFQNGYLATLETDHGDYWTLNESVINVNGQTGAAALTYGGKASASSIPVQGNTLQFVNHYFNRTPETGDRFIAFVVYSTSNYICGMRVTEAGSVTTAVIETVIQMGTSAKKYIHYVTFQLITTSSRSTAYISLNILTDIPVKFTASSLLPVLATISDGNPIPANGVLQVESSPPTNGLIFYLQLSEATSVTIVYYDGDTAGLQTRVFSSIAVQTITDIVIATS